MSTLGSRIRQSRGTLSQDAFAGRLHISKGSLGFYERDENLPNTNIILKICSETGVSLEWLMTGGGAMYAEPSQRPRTDGPPPDRDAYCARCARLEARLERLEEERRELSAENRQLWKENGQLREKAARLDETVRRTDVQAGHTARPGAA